MKIFTLFTYFFLFAYVFSLDFGDNCDLADDLCERSKFLQCGALENVCECQNPQKAWYDSREGYCKLLVGSSCENKVNESVQPCVTDGFCPLNSNNPTCTCSTGFEENVERRCFVPYEGTCTEGDVGPNDRCDPAAFLKCQFFNNGYVCQCQEPYDSLYDVINKTCNLLTKAGCLPLPHAMQCESRGFCDLNERICKCSAEFQETPERRCFLRYGADCDPFEDECNSVGYTTCHPEFSKCFCRPEFEAIYDTSTTSCRLLENAGCSVELDAQRCINESSCEPAQGSEPRRCKCLNNLKPNKNRECFLTNGDPCDLIVDLCDPAGYLSCSTSNKCSCSYSNANYDPETKECRMNLGASCKIGDGEPLCTKNAECLQGFCSCLPLYEDSGDGKCFRSYEAPCSTEDICNPSNFLYCPNGMCTCTPGFQQSTFLETTTKVFCLPGYGTACPFGEDLLPCNPEAQLSCVGGSCICSGSGHQVYLQDERRCANLAGSSCIPQLQNSSISSQVCVPHAECRVQNFLPGKCECYLGYRQSITGMCVSGSKSLMVNFGLYLVTFIVGIHI